MALSGIVFFSLAIRAKNAELEVKLLNISELNTLVDDLKFKVDQENEIKKDTLLIFGDHIKCLYEVANTLLSCSDTSEKIRSMHLRKIKEELRKMREPENLLKHEQLVNQYMDNIVLRLKEECSFLSSENITFITFLFSNFNIPLICLIFDMTMGAVYTKKSRLVKKISESNAPHKELFIRYMH